MRIFKNFFGAQRRKSPWVVRFDCGGCNGCSVEALVALSPLFGGQRFGLCETNSPDLADILLVMGAPGPRTAEGLRAVRDRMRSPGAVVAVGDCALNGGPLRQERDAAGGVGTVVSVGIGVPGCPPRPEAVLRGVLQALETFDPRPQGTF
ncbi:NADH-quinone oxidoreductase subunit B family protein [Fundidesulfovibrio butyratiphilus]